MAACDAEIISIRAAVHNPQIPAVEHGLRFDQPIPRAIDRMRVEWRWHETASSASRLPRWAQSQRERLILTTHESRTLHFPLGEKVAIKRRPHAAVGSQIEAEPMDPQRHCLKTNSAANYSTLVAVKVPDTSKG
jgi:hypothetical protein